MAKRGNLDRLSSFPDDILSHILTFIPMKAAVQTSVLSTRWRYLFASMSTLDLDNIMYRENVIGVKNFVYMLLHSSNQRSLECFRVTSVPEAYHDCISHWVYFALRRGVKEIDLRLPRLDHIDEILTPLFTCQSLVTLKLNLGHCDIKVPCTVCLPNLKCFHLWNFALTDDLIFRLISSCCVLEDLVLDVSDYQFYKSSEINIQSLSLKTLVLEFDGMEMEEEKGLDYVMVINAPSLVYFEYDGYMAKDYIISNMTSLIKAKINIYCFVDIDHEQIVIRLLQGICNVRSLSLSIDDDNDTLFQTRIDPVLAFPNLVELEFYSRRNNWNGTHWIETRLVEFLHFVPNLKTLILNLAVAKRKFIFPHEVPSCLSSHLKEIKISFFRGEEHMLEMISYLLVNAMVLEKLRLGIERIETHDLSYSSLLDHDLSSSSLDHDDVYDSLFDLKQSYSSLREQSSVLQKLLSLPRSSSTCQVLTF